jgi:phosphogluconate dehydratase
MLRPVADPFDAEGGLKLLKGNLGRCVIKTSAVKPEHRKVEAPAIVFDDQDQFLVAFKAGALDRDFIAVVRFQGPQANGMPELHSLSPALGVLQDRGRKVALVTDGRMSGASGKTPAAIHLSPEALSGGPISRLQTGDVIRLDAEAGVLQALVDPAELLGRPAATGPTDPPFGYGRELFAHMRKAASAAEQGGTALFS